MNDLKIVANFKGLTENVTHTPVVVDIVRLKNGTFFMESAQKDGSWVKITRHQAKNIIERFANQQLG